MEVHVNPVTAQLWVGRAVITWNTLELIISTTDDDADDDDADDVDKDNHDKNEDDDDYDDDDDGDDNCYDDDENISANSHRQ
jgi:hypothetical protein